MAVTLTSEMINGALQTQSKYGVPASFTLAKIMVESGGSYPGGLSGLAYRDNNLFGIKAGTWKGKTATYKTKEFVNGQYITITDKFRKYDSVAESIDDLGKVLSQPIYTNKSQYAKSLDEYIDIVSPIYGTDPNSATVLKKVIKQNNLTQYDDKNLFSNSNSVLKNPVKNTVSSVSTSTTVNTVQTSSKGDSILTSVTRVTTIVLLIVLAVLLLLKAFNITPKKVASRVIEKKTGVDVDELGGA